MNYYFELRIYSGKKRKKSSIANPQLQNVLQALTAMQTSEFESDIVLELKSRIYNSESDKLRDSVIINNEKIEDSLRVIKDGNNLWLSYLNEKSELMLYTNPMEKESKFVPFDGDLIDIKCLTGNFDFVVKKFTEFFLNKNLLPGDGLDY